MVQGESEVRVFQICSIQYGWFEVRLGTAYLECSDYLDCDTPRLFLRAVLRLLLKETAEEWVCWQDEPGACIMQLAGAGDRLRLRGFDSARPSYELELTADSLKRSRGACWLNVDVPAPGIARDLVREFSAYAAGDGLAAYEKHWMKFPEEEYRALKAFEEKL